MATLLKDELREASFRGVGFKVHVAEMTAGRRTQLHEYPLRDIPLAQDMGRASRFPRFQGVVVGRDYITQASKLIEALETNGPGELVHPMFGTMQVSVLEPATIIFDEALGKAMFNLSFVESGLLKYPSATVATQAITQTAASSLLDKAAEFFGQVFQVAGYINQVAVRALAVYSVVQSAITNPLQFGLRVFGLTTVWGNLNSLSSIFTSPFTLGRAVNARLNVAPIAKTGALTAGATSPAQADAMLITHASAILAVANHPALSDPLGTVSIRAPAVANPAVSASVNPSNLALAQQYLDKTTAYASAGNAATAPGGYLPLPTLPTIAGITPASMQAYVNASVQYAQVRQALIAQAAGLSSLLQGAVYDDVIAFRNQLTSAIDREMLALSQLVQALQLGDQARAFTGQSPAPFPGVALDALQTALMDLRSAVWEDLTLRSRNSARLITIILHQTSPALKVAYDRYEDATRQTEIIGRNKVVRPGFVPAGTIQVLNA